MPDPTPNPGPELIKAVSEVMAKVEGVEKDGHMSGAGNYDYASIEGIILAVRNEMIQAGLTLWPTRPPRAAENFGADASPFTLDQFTTGGGSHMNLIVGEFCWRLCHTSGEWDYIYATGDGADVGDKAAAKAQAAALKIALLHTFLLPRGNIDPDHESSEGMERSQPQPASRPATPEPQRSPLRDAVAAEAAKRSIPNQAVADFLSSRIGSSSIKAWATRNNYTESGDATVEEIAMTLIDQVQEWGEETMNRHPDEMDFE